MDVKDLLTPFIAIALFVVIYSLPLSILSLAVAVFTYANQRKKTALSLAIIGILLLILYFCDISIFPEQD